MIAAEKSREKPRIVIVSGFPIPQNPRVVKEADALADAGFDVHVLSAIFKPDQVGATRRRLKGRDWVCHIVVDAAARGLAGWRWNYHRLRRYAVRQLPGTPAQKYRSQIHYDLPRLTRWAMRLRGDFYSLHLEASLFVADRLIAREIPYSVDMEDWYSEDFIQDGPTRRAILSQQEEKVLKAAQFTTTTSQSLAEALADRYEINRPHVIYNSFPDEDFPPIHDAAAELTTGAMNICWFSQTIGEGRGIELLLSASKLAQIPINVHLRGHVNAEYWQQLTELCSGASVNLHHHPLCHHHELHGWLWEQDIGFASEIGNCASRDLTITNKILQYLQAGLFVVATNTAGQREVALKADGAVAVFDESSPQALSDILVQYAADRVALREQKRKSRSIYQTQFEWRHSATRLNRLFSQAFQGKRERPYGD